MSQFFCENPKQLKPDDPFCLRSHTQGRIRNQPVVIPLLITVQACALNFMEYVITGNHTCRLWHLGGLCFKINPVFLIQIYLPTEYEHVGFVSVVVSHPCLCEGNSLSYIHSQDNKVGWGTIQVAPSHQSRRQ